jgi:N6-L-threonylcarbamoyladenine synthase
MWVLGIETSCDETAAGVVGPHGVASDVIFGQEIHTLYGGVVPEFAGRAHAEKITLAVDAALRAAGLERPDVVAATAGPGLMGAVLVGLSFGKALSAAWDVPFVAVNHLEAHLLAPLLDDPRPELPFLCLLVSGGHTALYACESLGTYRLLGQTIDDAAGEAYDKVARMVGLGYPGGPFVDALAAQGNPHAVDLPRPRPRSDLGPTSRRRATLVRSPLDMSFSGLKTAVRKELESPTPASPADLCASFQEAVADVLCDRLLRAAQITGIERVCIGGGVAANSRLRARVAALPLHSYLPPRSRCTDNGAMIANVGRLRALSGQQDPLDVTARASWPPGEPPTRISP